MGKILLDPQLGGSKVRYGMRHFNASKIIETFIGRIGWFIVVIAALSLSFWSLYFVGRKYGLPIELAVLISLTFDGAAIASANLALKYARSGNDSGLAPRMAVFILAGASAYLNSQHAILIHAPTAAIVLYACPPIVAVMIFELQSRYERRNALRKAGRVAKVLPVFGRWAWILFPLRSLKMMRGIILRRLNQFDENSPTYAMAENIVILPDARQIRAWAIQRGISIGEKGRISGEIVAAYQAEQFELEAKKEPNIGLIEPNKSISDITEDNSGEMGASL